MTRAQTFVRLTAVALALLCGGPASEALAHHGEPGSLLSRITLADGRVLANGGGGPTAGGAAAAK